MRTTLNLSDDIINEAVKITGNKNKTELINTALKEYLRLLKRKKLISMRGTGVINPDYNITKERELENEEL